jgi:hypothetical protein
MDQFRSIIQRGWTLGGGPFLRFVQLPGKKTAGTPVSLWRELLTWSISADEHMADSARC